MVPVVILNRLNAHPAVMGWPLNRNILWWKKIQRTTKVISPVVSNVPPVNSMAFKIKSIVSNVHGVIIRRTMEPSCVTFVLRVYIQVMIQPSTLDKFPAIVIAHRGNTRNQKWNGAPRARLDFPRQTIQCTPPIQNQVKMPAPSALLDGIPPLMLLI